MIRRVVIVLLSMILLAFGTLAWLSRHSFVRESVQVPVPWSASALDDSTLMLQKWLVLRGFKSHRQGGPILRGELPPGGTVFLLYLSSPLTEGEVETLLAWVREGGCLVVDATVAPFNNERGTKILMDRLGASLKKSEKAGDAPEMATYEDTFVKGETPYRVRRNQEWRLRLEDPRWERILSDDAGEVLATRQEGIGRLVLVSDCSFFHNFVFGELDHAAWLARVLTEAGAEPGKGAVIWSKAVEMALFPWLWNQSRPFLIAFAVLLVAWLWSGLFRFGALLPPEPTARRSLLEHLEASGRFLWRHGGRDALLATGRAAVGRRAANVYPVFPSLSHAERLAFLAQRSGLPEAEVADALDEHPGISAEDQALRLQILQVLRQRLTHS